ncbi:MAG: hypothetical protein D6758_09500 [Gammaproteobacteria bacterium]|nr:MAG: hypothetical protein D6758_09500 [Gammaproteobacteria bacterium]
MPDPAVFFRESARVLRPGGRVLVTTLLPGTLGEMERAWKQADPEGVHVNRFAPEKQITGGLEQAGLKMTWRQTLAEVCHYPDARTGARAVKDVGAHNMNPGRPARLTGKARWQAFEHAWEQVRTARGLPLTYHVLFLEAIKR